MPRYYGAFGVGYGNRNGRLYVHMLLDPYACIAPFHSGPLDQLQEHHECRRPRVTSVFWNVVSNRLVPLPHRNNDMFASQCGGVDHGGINLDRLSGLVTRLILPNHLTRPDAGCHGGALCGCTPPPPPHCHGSAHVNNGCRLPCVHTCPSATLPYMATNNVFVITANIVHQQPQVGATVPPGTSNLNNINMLLGGLGLGLGAVNPACGGGLSLPCRLNTTHGSGAGLGAQLNPNRPSCPSCHGHL